MGPETAVEAAGAADGAEADCADWSWVRQSADVLLVEDDEVVCVAGDDVVVEAEPGVAEVVCVGESTAVEPAVPVDGDRRVGSWAEER